MRENRISKGIGKAIGLFQKARADSARQAEAANVEATETEATKTAS